MSRGLNAEVAQKVMGIDLSIAPAHDWRRDDDGEIDMLGMDADTHNGPACRRCGYGFCIHCEGDAGYTAQPCQVSPPAYSTNIAAAWLVVDKMQSELWAVTVTNLFDDKTFHLDRYECCFTGFDSETRASAPTAAEAICRAALAAVGGEGWGDE